MFDSRLLARYIWYVAKENDIDMNFTKTHKLLYILDGFMLAEGHNIVGENCRAWQYGPVYPKVQNMLQKTPIDTLGNEWEDDFDDLEKDPKLKDAVKIFVDTFGRRSAVDLSEWSHEEGSPWDQAIKKNGELYCVIPKETIQAYFKDLVDDAMEGENE